MNIARHMETVFVVALAAAGSGSYFLHQPPQRQSQAGSAAIVDSSIATDTKTAVVVVKGKRPSAAQPTLLADRRAGGNRI